MKGIPQVFLFPVALWGVLGGVEGAEYHPVFQQGPARAPLALGQGGAGGRFGEWGIPASPSAGIPAVQQQQRYLYAPFGGVYPSAIRTSLGATLEGCVTPSEPLLPTPAAVNVCYVTEQVLFLTGGRLDSLKWGSIDVGCSPGSGEINYTLRSQPRFRGARGVGDFFSAVYKRGTAGVDYRSISLPLPEFCECMPMPKSGFFAEVYEKEQFITSVVVQSPPRRDYLFHPDETTCPLPALPFSLATPADRQSLLSPSAPLRIGEPIELGECFFRLFLTDYPSTILASYNRVAVRIGSSSQATGTEVESAEFEVKLSPSCTMLNPEVDLRVWVREMEATVLTEHPAAWMEESGGGGRAAAAPPGRRGWGVPPLDHGVQETGGSRNGVKGHAVFFYTHPARLSLQKANAAAAFSPYRRLNTRPEFDLERDQLLTSVRDNY